MAPADFVNSLCSLSFPNTFNPYSSRCPVHDRADAPSRRMAALTRMLVAASECEVDSIWIGRDLGHRGGRRTGLALTDDLHITAHADRWSIKANRPTKGDPVAERTAAVIWQILSRIELPIFLWNVFPLHPHEADEPFTNRAHNSKERAAGEEVLAELIRLLRPGRVVAVGNDAAKSLRKIAPDIECLVFRHPSYGGQNIFLRQVRETYQCQKEPLL